MGGSKTPKSGSETGIDPTQLGFLRNLWGSAQQQGNVPVQYYPGQTVRRDPRVNQTLQAIYQRGSEGSSLLRGAEAQNRRTATGEFLHPSTNQALRETFGTASQNLRTAYGSGVNPNLQARFRGSNLRNARGAAAGQVGAAQQGLGAEMFGSNYRQERGRQLSAAQAAPGFQQARLGDLAIATGAQGQLEGRLQQLVDAQAARFNFEQGEPRERLQRYAGAVGSPQIGGRQRQRKAWDAHIL